MSIEEDKVAVESSAVEEPSVNETVIAEAEAETPAAEAEEVTEDALEAAVNERLSKMKANMDRMASERDEALKIKNQMEADAKSAKIKQLEEEGKLQELAEMKIADLEAKLKVFEAENVKLNRDNVVNTKLGALDFRNDRSRDMARKDIVDQLVQSEEGAWVPPSGVGLHAFLTHPQRVKTTLSYSVSNPILGLALPQLHHRPLLHQKTKALWTCLLMRYSL